MKLIFSAFLLCATSCGPPEWLVSEDHPDTDDRDGKDSGELDQLPQTICHLKDGVRVDQEVNEEDHDEGSEEPVATGHDVMKNFSHGNG